jgi:diguanylate cyclase (GGDEF)-like protein
VVFVSAQTGVQQITQALEPGAVDFITKPLNVSVLRARVKTHLNAKFQTDYFRLRSSMDPLTGVFNFRDLEQRLESEWARAHRADSPLTLVIVSADGFDAFSEAQGKSAADERLKQIAAILKHRMRRPADMIARYGPAVFVCLLPETALGAALTVAHATFAELEQKNLIQENASSTLRLTVSAGLVARASKCAGDVAGLFLLAQQQLLLAQQSGGNQVCSDTFAP